MHILELEARDIQRLKAIRKVVTAKDGRVIIVGGKNDQGKSSLIDCIEFALVGKKSFSEDPIRHGAESGKVRLKTDEFELHQSIETDPAGKIVEKVTILGGQPGETPAKLRKRIESKLLDPLAFALMDKAGQTEVMKSLIPFDFSAHEKYRKARYDQRTGVNRFLEQKKAENDANPFDPTFPIDEIPAATGDAFNELLRKQAQRVELQGHLSRAPQKIADIDQSINELRQKIMTLEAQREVIQQWVKENEPKLAEFGDVDTQVASFQQEQSERETKNARIRKNAEAKRIFEEFKRFQKESSEITAELETLDATKLQAITTAKLPVAGLSLDEEKGVLFEGVPFAQLSASKRLKVSTAMGIAQNPLVRVLLIREGEKLDEENLAILIEMAEQHDMQIWLERVGKGAECSLIIEDGEILEDRNA